MGLVLGLGLGVGLLLVATAFLVPRRATRRDVGGLAQLLERAGLPNLTPANVLVGCVVAALAAFVSVQAISGTATVSLVFAAMAGYLPLAVLTGRARRRSREQADVWPDAVDNLASGVRAGMSLAEALISLGERGPEPLRPYFVAFGADYQAGGRFGDSLDRLKGRLADPVGDRVVEGLRVAREVGGGDLGRLLRNLSGHLRDDARTRSELEARQAWTVNGARLAVAAPWLVLFTVSFQHEVISRYQSATGAAVLVVGAGLCLVAYRLMLRIGRLPAERRVLG